MSAHASVDALSGYVDAVLDEEERRRLEEHLDTCSDCRHRLQGLRDVVRRLETLDVVTPPDDLGRRMTWRIAQEGLRESWMTRFERGLGRFVLNSAQFSLLALVVALAAILYLFAHGLDRSTGRTRVVFPSSESVVLSEGAREAEPARQISGLEFRRVDGVWWAADVEPGSPAEVLDARDPMTAGSVGESFDLESLSTLGGPVVVRLQGKVIELTW